MFNYEDIYKMMREGKSAEDIAKTFSDNLNKAQAQMDAEKKKAEEEAKTNARLMEYVAAITDALNNYVHLKFPNEYDDDDYLTTEEVAQMLDEAYGAAIKLRKHLRPLEDWVRASSHDDDIIADFLTKLRF